MRANIAGRVRNTHLPKTKPLLPLFEAVMNAFQAIEERGGEGHRITIQAERQGNLDDDKPGPIEAFIISDTGVGFTDVNYDSFQTVDSSYKASCGGKGLGRFLWLKAFLRVEIESHYHSNGHDGLLCRSFSFVASDEDQICEPTPSKQSRPGTIVRLIGYRSPYADEVPRQFEIIAQQLIGHFLPFFLNHTGPKLILSDATDEIDLRTFFCDNFQTFAAKRTFEVVGQTFRLIGFRLRGALATHHELVYAAHFREVITERLAKFLPNLKNKLHDGEQPAFYFLAFLQSAFLDEKVNSERTDFSIPKEPMADRVAPATGASSAMPDLLEDEISMKAIRDAALSAVSDELQPFLDEINTQKEAALTTYIVQDAPQYRVLMRHIGDFISQVPPQATKTEMEMTLHRQLYQRQVELKNESVRIISEADAVHDPHYYLERFKDFMERFNEIGKSALAQYIVHRRVILELLDKALSQDPATGRYALEKTVHRIVFPMRTTSDDVPFEQQNLWIIDERLTFHSFLASDQPLRSLSVVDIDSGSRPDILIFNRPLAFTEDGPPITSMVVVEFKRPDRDDYKDEDPIKQVYRMVREIRSGHRKDHKGREVRPLTNTIPAYCYIICDLTGPLETRLQDMGAFPMPDNLGYYGFNQNLNAYYEVISYRKLISDAKKRNRILFEKLNLPTTI